MFKASYSTNSVFLIQNGLFKLKKGKVEVLETKKRANEREKYLQQFWFNKLKSILKILNF
jgi:hypothetical protein